MSPEPVKSPMPTPLRSDVVCAVRPFSAATLSITPLAKATSMVRQERAVSASMSVPYIPFVAVSLEYAKICIVCPALRPKIVPCVLVLASERRARGVAKSAASVACWPPPPVLPPPRFPSYIWRQATVEATASSSEPGA